MALAIKNPPARAGDMRLEFDLWVGKISGRRAWLPTPVFLPGACHGQRSLVGYSPLGYKEFDTTEHACVYICVCLYTYIHACVHVCSVISVVSDSLPPYGL